MSNNAPTNYKLGKLVLIGMVVQLMVIAYVLYAGYQGRQQISTAVQAGCARNKISNKANATGWRIAQKARLADGQPVIAERYGNLAESLEERASINCLKAYPKARLIP